MAEKGIPIDKNGRDGSHNRYLDFKTEIIRGVSGGLALFPSKTIWGGSPTPSGCEVNCEVDPAYYLRKDTKAGEPVSRFPHSLRVVTCSFLLYSPPDRC